MKKGIGFFTILVCLFLFSLASAQPKGTLTVAVNTDVNGLDPVPLIDIDVGRNIARQICDGLITFGPDGKIQPRLAVSWKLQDDKTWRFNLRKGVKFHNGAPFTAADVKFTMEWLMDPNNRWNLRGHFANFDRVEIVDDYTVDIKTKTPDPVIPNMFASRVFIFSKKLYDEQGKEGLQRQVMGTGPYKFVSWKRNEQLTIEANTDWYMTPPRVKTINFRVVPEMGARVAELQSGGAHIITGVPPFMVAQLKKTEGVEAISVPSLRAMYMMMDTIKMTELKDRRVRQAINYAVSKDAIVKGVLNGMGTPLGTHVPFQVGGADPSIKPYPYDPQKAKDLLKEAGYPNGFALSLYTPNGRYPMDKEVVLAVADQLSKVGLKTNVNVMETNTYIKDVSSKNLGGGLYFIGMGSPEWDIKFSLSLLDSRFVTCYYPDKAIDEMIGKTMAMMDPKQRYESAYRIQKLVYDEAIYLALYNAMETYGVSKKVKGFVGRADEFMDLWNVSLGD